MAKNLNLYRTQRFCCLLTGHAEIGQVTSLVNTIIFSGAEFIRFTVHTRSNSSSSTLSVLNTPMLSLRDLCALEDHNGLVCIDCGSEVRILIHTSTHPIWHHLYHQHQQQMTMTTRMMMPRLSTTRSLLRHWASWRIFHGSGSSMEDRSSSVPQILAVFAAWLFIAAVMVYPYAMIIYMTYSQMTTESTTTTTWSSCRVLMTACALALVWSSSSGNRLGLSN